MATGVGDVVPSFAGEPRRFLALFLFSCNAFLFAGPWLCFAPVSDVAAERFGVGAGAINTLAATYLWLYLPGTLLCLYLVDGYGVRESLLLSSVVNAVAVVGRYLATASTLLSPGAAYGWNMVFQACQLVAF